MNLTINESRLWEKVDKLSNPNGCWLFTGTKTWGGYGQIRVGKTMQRAHRVSWAIAKGDIPNGLWVLHRCDNPPCVNPDHLFLGTSQDNINDRVAKNRSVSTQPKRQGSKHPLSKLNEETVKLIRQERRDKKTPYKILSEKYGTNIRNIKKVVRFESWKHVPPESNGHFYRVEHPEQKGAA